MKQVEDKIALPYNRFAEENENNKSTTLHNNLHNNLTLQLSIYEVKFIKKLQRFISSPEDAPNGVKQTTYLNKNQWDRR